MDEVPIVIEKFLFRLIYKVSNGCTPKLETLIIWTLPSAINDSPIKNKVNFFVSFSNVFIFFNCESPSKFNLICIFNVVYYWSNGPFQNTHLLYTF